MTRMRGGQNWFRPIARRCLGLALIATLLAGCASVREWRSSRRAPPAAPVPLENPKGCGGTTQPACLVVKIFSVGQGSTAFAKFPNGSTLLFDAGASGAKNAEEVNKELTALIPANLTIEYLFLSHADNDHTNLLNKITKLDPLRLSAIHLSGRPKDYDTKEGLAFFRKIYTDPSKVSGDCNTGKKPNVKVKVFCYPAQQAGTRNDPDGFPRDLNARLFTYFLAVNVGEKSSPPVSSNAGSLVTAVNYAGVLVLFPGDAEGATQTFIAEKVPPMLWQNLSVYAMAHHGATTKGSNSEEWLADIRPKVYVASSSLHEGWYHPDGQTIYKITHRPQLKSRLLPLTRHKVFSSSSTDDPKYCYCELGKSVLSTFTNGTITILVDGSGNFTTNMAQNVAKQLEKCPTTGQYC